MNRETLLSHVYEVYGTKPEYLWSRFPDYAVLRHSSNNKWYAVVMDVPAEKLGLEGSEKIDIVNVKADPDDVIALNLAEDVMPAYHMNKKNWVSVVLDGRLPDDMITHLISVSYDLTL